MRLTVTSMVTHTTLISACVLLLTGCAGNVELGPDAVKGKTVDGTIDTSSAGDLWMQNEAGVILHLKAKRTELILSLGGDAVLISMNP